MSNLDPIKVCLLGMDEKKSSLFKIAFKMHAKRKYVLSEISEGTPSIFILDIDSPGASDILSELSEKYKDVPFFCTSIEPEKHNGILVLKKPIRMETLFPMITQALVEKKTAVDVKNFLNRNSEPENKSSDFEKKPFEKEKLPLEDFGFPEKNKEERVTSKKFLPPVNFSFWNIQEGVIGEIISFRKNKKVFLLSDLGNKKILSYNPETDTIETSLTNQEISSFILSGEKYKISNSEFLSNFSRSLSFDSFIWEIFPMICQGRISSSIDGNTMVHLKRWPNLTRMPTMEEDIRLCAFFARSPATPNLAIRLLQIDYRVLFNFLTACDAIGILYYAKIADQKKEKSIQEMQEKMERDEQKNSRRGFLGRLLSKIIGL